MRSGTDAVVGLTPTAPERTGVASGEFALEVRQHLPLDLLQTQRGERLLEEAADAARTLPLGGRGDRRPAAARRDDPGGDERRVRVRLGDRVARHGDRRLDVAG